MTKDTLSQIRERVEEQVSGANQFASDCVSSDAETWLMGYGFTNARTDIQLLLARVEKLERFGVKVRRYIAKYDPAAKHLDELRAALRGLEE